jgi:hypothetical protein
MDARASTGEKPETKVRSQRDRDDGQGLETWLDSGLLDPRDMGWIQTRSSPQFAQGDTGVESEAADIVPDPEGRVPHSASGLAGDLCLADHPRKDQIGLYP